MHHKSRWVRTGVAVFLCCGFILPTFAAFHAIKHNASEDLTNYDSILGIAEKVTDASTAETYHEILGLPSDGGRYAGRVWTDKSVLTEDFSEEMENRKVITVKNDSDFLTAFSALGSSRTVSHSEASPIDMVFVIDISTSMGNYNYVAEAMADAGLEGGFPSEEYHGVLEWSETRLEKTLRAVEQAAARLHQINPDSRTSIVAYGRSAATLLPLGSYEEIRLSSQDLGWASAWFHYFSVKAEAKQNGQWTTPVTISNESAKANNTGELRASEQACNQAGYTPGTGTQEANHHIPSNYFNKTEASKYLKGFKDHPDQPYYTDNNYYPSIDDYNNYDYYLIGSTNLDSGLYVAMNNLSKTADTTIEKDGQTINRIPAVIAMTDGSTNCITVGDNWYTPGINGTYRNNLYPGNNNGLYTASTSLGTPATTNQDAGITAFPVIAAKTIMSAAYMKQQVINHYTPHNSTEAPHFGVYTIGYDLNASNEHLLAVLNPAEKFHAGYTEGNQTTINSAYETWEKWAKDGTASLNISNTAFVSARFLPSTYTFAALPNNSAITHDDVVRNINYVDHYYSADTENGSNQTIDRIFENAIIDFTGTAFYPTDDSITSHTSIEYKDTIGEYMEVKDMKALLLFGKEYPIKQKNTEQLADGSTVTTFVATAENGQDLELVNENYNHKPSFYLSEISIKLTEDTEHHQTLIIGLPQNALPLRIESVQTALEIDYSLNQYLEKVTSYQSNSASDNAKPLRIFYTVGTQDRIKNDQGTVDYDKISDEYKARHLVTDQDGNELIELFSNHYDPAAEQQNSRRKARSASNSDGASADSNDSPESDNSVTIHFTPSQANRFYYFQKNRIIYHEASGLDANGEGTLKSFGGEAEVNRPVTNINTMQDDESYYLVIDFYRPTASAGEYVEYVVTRSGEELKDVLTYFNPQTNTSGDTPALAGGNLSDVVVATRIGGQRLGRLNRFTRYKNVNLTSTAPYSYQPTYYATSGSTSISVQLGNNGRLTLSDNPDYGEEIEIPDPDVPKDPFPNLPDESNPDGELNPDEPLNPLGTTDQTKSTPNAGNIAANSNQNSALADCSLLLPITILVGFCYVNFHKLRQHHRDNQA